MRGMRIVVTGATGLLGGWLVSELANAGDEVIAFGGPSRGKNGLDVTDGPAVTAAIVAARPDAVIHAAALSAMSDCARAPDLARRINVEGTANVVAACREAGARLVHVSTDLVFDGEHAPYDTSSPTAPTSVYGRTKADAEREVAQVEGVVVRVSLLFGPTRTARRGFFDQQLDMLRRGERLRLFHDEWRTPLSLRAAAEALSAIARSDVKGVLHVGGPERLSRWEMGLALAGVLGLPRHVAESSIERASRTSIGGEPRPRDVSLDSTAFRRAFPGIAVEPFAKECARMGVSSEA